MALVGSYPASGNTFVPSFDATGKLVVAFSRNEKDFPVNQYVHITKVEKEKGFYLRIDTTEADQIAGGTSSNYSEFLWHDGNDAPQLTWGTEAFKFFPYETERQVNGWKLGYKALEQADFDLRGYLNAIHAQKCMTIRTARVSTVLETAANYDSGHTSDVDAIADQWDAGTATTPFILESLNHGLQTIQKATYYSVKPEDVIVRINPVAAAKMAESQEVHTYVKENPVAKEKLLGKGPFKASQYGFPLDLYGYNWVIEDATVNSSLDNVAVSRSYIADDDKAVMLLRPGGINSAAGQGNFSTCHLFVYEEMTVENRDDPDNRRENGRVITDYDVKLVAPATCFLFTDILT